MNHPFENHPLFSLNEAATNYQSLTDYETWVLSVTMLLGRLEVFSVLVLFTPEFWRR